jgi:2',3'-cyclic-nucleotide 2'-phosphodiesterase/3'-nucleotidase
VFPGPDYADRPGIDAVRGTLAGVPAVMPGFWGSHLGLIDLDLVHDGGRWTVSAFQTEARPIYRRDQGKIVSLAEPEPAILQAAAQAHQATLEWVRRPVGQVAFPVHSYFALLGSEASVGLVNAGQTWYARALLDGTPYANLPLLSAAAPFKAGGTGPDSFVDIQPGPLALRDIADLYQFANTLVAVKITGAQVAAWLERSTGVFQQIDSAQDGPQELLVRGFPTYNFDVISGVTYRIDITQPSRFDGRGDVVRPEASRIVDLRYQGQPIDPRQDFVVVTNNYRSDGGGRFPGLDGRGVVLRAPDLNRDAIVKYIETQGRLLDAPPETWRFATPARKLQLAFRAAPAATRYLADHPGLRAMDGLDEGYLRFVLHLG